MELYPLVRWLCRVIVRSFFSELTVINQERVPLYGPVIFVGNHNNQFMDASMLVALLPRRVRFLVAEKSMKRKVIGSIAKITGCIPVKRQGDITYEGIGRVRWTCAKPTTGRCIEDLQMEGGPSGSQFAQRVGFAQKESGGHGGKGDTERAIREPDKPIGLPQGGSDARRHDFEEPTNKEEAQRFEGPRATESTTIYGVDTRFTIDLRVGYKLHFGRKELSETIATVSTILSDTELTVESEIAVECPDPDCGVCFMVLPKADQSEVYDAVSESLKAGDTIGIFPEGGSHDQTNLLPLKAGVAVMALSSALDGAEDIMILPVGLTYDQADHFESRATVNIGMPIPVTEDLVDFYQVSRRQATAKLLSLVEEGLRNCILTAQDHDTLDCIKLCSNLFPPERLRLSRDRYHSLHQTFSKLFWHFGSDPEIVALKDTLQDYQRHLQQYAILDTEVWHLKQSTAGATLGLVEKCGSLVVALILGLPLAILWGPLRLIAYWLAERHRLVAVAGSRVKIKGTDVIASYKILVLMVLLPAVNILYGLLFGMLFMRTYIDLLFSVTFCLCILPILFYYSIQHADAIVPLCRQIKTHIYVITGRINVWRDTERELITHRIEAQLTVRKIVDEFSPRISSTFIETFYQFIPKLVLEADTKRLRQNKDEWCPIVFGKRVAHREEIL